jgi:hypothetical protein
VALGERQEEAVVALANRFPVVDGFELLPGVLPDRFQHSQSAGSVGLPTAHEQALGDEPVERVDAGAGQGLRRLDGGAAGEHREAGEARLFVLPEERVAPVDCGAQRPLARGRITRRRAQGAERVVQAVGDLTWRQQAAAGGGQLDREWEPVDASADVRHRGGRSVAHLERRIVCSRALPEQRDGVFTGGRLRVRGRLVRRQRQRQYGMKLFGVHGQRLATRRQHGQRRTSRRQSADERRGGRQVLAVVDEQQQMLGGEEALNRLLGRLARERDDPERTDHGRGNALRSSHSRERH